MLNCCFPGAARKRVHVAGIHVTPTGIWSVADSRQGTWMPLPKGRCMSVSLCLMQFINVTGLEAKESLGWIFEAKVSLRPVQF